METPVPVKLEEQASAKLTASCEYSPGERVRPGGSRYLHGWGASNFLGARVLLHLARVALELKNLDWAARVIPEGIELDHDWIHPGVRQVIVDY